MPSADVARARGIKEKGGMYDVAQDVKADTAANQYLVHTRYLMNLDVGTPANNAGNQERPVKVDVRVCIPMFSQDGKAIEQWERPYSTTLTRQECEDNPEVLFEILNKRLSYQYWQYVLWSDAEFDSEGDNQEFYNSCYPSYTGLNSQDEIKNELRDLLTDENYGLMSWMSRFSESTWTFVLKCNPRKLKMHTCTKNERHSSHRSFEHGHRV
jgi:hypothetical protein